MILLVKTGYKRDGFNKVIINKKDGRVKRELSYARKQRGKIAIDISDGLPFVSLNGLTIHRRKNKTMDSRVGTNLPNSQKGMLSNPRNSQINRFRIK